jgi:anti-anti-sigma factor
LETTLPRDEGTIPEVVADLKESPDGVFVRLRGELDLTNVEKLERTILSLVERGTPVTWVVEMAELESADRSGLPLISPAAPKAKKVLLLHASPVLGDVINATGLSPVQKVEP